jgi:hypothetical protein
VPRTTLDIDAPILRDLKKRQRREGKSLGRLVSDLLARAMDSSESKETDPPFTWNSRPMGARVDVADKEAVRAILDRP